MCHKDINQGYEVFYSTTDTVLTANLVECQDLPNPVFMLINIYYRFSNEL